MPASHVPAAREALLRQMYAVFSTEERDAFIPRSLAPDVDWPNLLDNTRARGIPAVRAYWARQFAVMHPLVHLERLRLDDDGRRVVAIVRPGLRDETGDHWAPTTVEHVYTFREDGLVTRMDIRHP